MNYYEIVKDYYNKLSRDYENLYRKEQVKKILKILSFIKGKRILDAGCGTGILEEFIDGEVYLVDISEKMIEIARRKHGNKFKYVVCNILNLPFEENFFDCVVSITVLQDLMLEDVRKALEEFLRVLKPGGRLIISFIKKEEYIEEFFKNLKNVEVLECFEDEKELYFVGEKKVEAFAQRVKVYKTMRRGVKTW